MKRLFFIVMLIGFNCAQSMNLLSNGSFNADLSGWNSPFSDCQWDAGEGGPISGNGSMRCTTDFHNNTVFGPTSDLLTIKPGYWYLTAGSFKTPAVSTSERGLYWVDWFDGSETFIRRDTVNGGYGVDDDVWIPLDGYFKAPDNAVSVEFRVLLQNGIPDVDVDPAFGFWDDVVFMEETIFFSNFD